MLSFLIGCAGALVLLGMMLGGLWLILRWDDGSEAMDAKQRSYDENRKKPTSSGHE